MSGRSFSDEGLASCLLIALAASGCNLAPSAKPAPPTTTRVQAAVEFGPQEREAQPAAMSVPEWQFTVSIYAWLASKRGVIETSNVTIPLDDPDESTGLFLFVEGERGRWGFVADLDVFSSTDQADGLAGTIEIDEDTVIGEVDVTFRPDEDSALQFLAGLRVLDSAQEIRFPILQDRESDFTQIDPVFGAQATWPVGDQFRFRLRGDIGGFGIDSDFTYQVAGIFGWEFASRWQLTAGYRILGWEFEANDVRNDLRLSGLLFGVAASF